MQKITPFLWFDNNAEEAAQFYTSIFKNSKILNVSRYGDAGNKLTSGGGKESECGWLKDRFGFSWQIVPTALGMLMSDPKKANRVMQAVLQMKKLDIAKLEEAAEGQVAASR